MTQILPILRSILNVKTVEKLDLRVAKSIYRSARDSYYNTGKSDLTDAEYDALEDLIKLLDPGYSLLKKTGAKVGSKSEVPLIVPMPSLAKIKIENQSSLDRFLKLVYDQGSGTYVSAKIDGSSVEVFYLKGKLNRIVTRGDGTTGKDISHFIPFVSRAKWSPGDPGLPKTINCSTSKVLRMEATIKKLVHQSKYADEYASDRAMASAVFNRHDASPALKDIDFVLLSVVRPLATSETTDLFAAEHGFIRPMSSHSYKSVCTKEKLESIMSRFQRVSPYSLDGLVVGMTNDCEPISSNLPKLTKSVKIDDHANAPMTVITEILWQPSSFGVLVPKAIIKPVKFGNVTVKQAALHNVKWAQDRGAGVGAFVKIIRSGEIIPKIIEVVKPAEFEFPDTKVFGSYQFDGTRIILAEGGLDVQAKKVQRMFGALGLEDLGQGFSEKLVEAGYLNTRDVLSMSLQDVQALPGVKTSAKKIHAQLSRASKGEFTLPELMNASGVFKSGLGSTLLNKLASDHPRAFRDVEALLAFSNSYSHVMESIGPARASILREGIQAFYEWVQGLPVRPFTRADKVDGPLSGKNFAWTGYRSEQEENLVKSFGGNVSSFSAKTDFLFFKAEGKKSSKVEKAGSKAVTFEQWHNKVGGKL